MYFCFNDDGLGGCGLTEHGFARLWANVRGNSGVKGGKYCYTVTVEENVSVELPESDDEHHAIRYRVHVSPRYLNEQGLTLMLRLWNAY